MDALLPALASPAFDAFKAVLCRLAAAPPQVLLLEGGSAAQRRDMALYWAMCCNCAQVAVAGAPCLACPVCRQMAGGEHLDLAAYDGGIRTREDTENPGLVRAFTMANVRLLRRRLRDAPHGGGRRVVLLMGLGQTRDEAANALLTALEEPSATTVFVLLAPQREQLLPTLVSRAFCLTLPWQPDTAAEAALAPWEDALAVFLETGQGFLERASAKGAMDAAGADALLLACQKAMIRVLAANATPQRLDAALAPLDATGRAVACRWLAEAQEALRYGVTPARVLEALAARLFVLRRQRGVA